LAHAPRRDGVAAANSLNCIFASTSAFVTRTLFINDSSSRYSKSASMMGVARSKYDWMFVPSTTTTTRDTLPASLLARIIGANLLSSCNTFSTVSDSM
jgi:hypothetical protein